jgi:hypothetical protein
MRTAPIKPQLLAAPAITDVCGRPLTASDQPAPGSRGWCRRAARLWLIAVGVILAATALDKLMHLPAMVSTVAAYNLVPPALAGVAAASLITAEITGSLLLLVPRWQPKGAIVAIVLFAVFAVVVAASVVNRMDIDCGCSNLLAPSMKVSWLLAGRNLALALACVVALDQLRASGTATHGTSRFLRLGRNYGIAAAALTASVYMTARWQTVTTGLLALPAFVAGQVFAACENPSGGYQGFGATSGGAGQTVYTVTRLDDPNPTVAGTLRDALKSGNRCIVFHVGGVITLNPDLRHLTSSGSNITVDGFTAPSPGITVEDYGSTFSGSDVIIRGIRFRNAQGCNSCTSHGNGIVIRGQRVVVDRVSIDGYGDQALGIGKGGMLVTVQWSIFGRASDPTHNFPFLVNGWAAGDPGGPETNRVSIHHNLFIDGATRNPQATWDQTKPYQTYVTADIRNNLIWNFLNYGTVVNKRAQVNVINNYYKRSSGANDRNALWLETEGRAYTSGNVASDNGNLNDNGTQGSAYSAAAVTTTGACTAAYDVIRLAGARGPNFGLDGVDLTYIESISIPLPNCPNPAQFSDLTATAVSSSQINLAWRDTAADETGVKREHKTGARDTYGPPQDFIDLEDTEIRWSSQGRVYPREQR